VKLIERKGRFVVYDKDNLIVIITREKNIAKYYARKQHGSKKTRRSK